MLGCMLVTLSYKRNCNSQRSAAVTIDWQTKKQSVEVGSVGVQWSGLMKHARVIDVRRVMLWLVAVVFGHHIWQVM